MATHTPFEQRPTAEVIAHQDRRGTRANYVEELGNGFGMRGMPCGRQHANGAWFRIGALAYKLFLMRQAFALPPELPDVTVGAGRWGLYEVAARLVRHTRRVVLEVATDAATFAILPGLRLVSRGLPSRDIASGTVSRITGKRRQRVSARHEACTHEGYMAVSSIARTTSITVLTSRAPPQPESTPASRPIAGFGWMLPRRRK